METRSKFIFTKVVLKIYFLLFVFILSIILLDTFIGFVNQFILNIVMPFFHLQQYMHGPILFVLILGLFLLITFGMDLLTWKQTKKQNLNH